MRTLWLPESAITDDAAVRRLKGTVPMSDHYDEIVAERAQVRVDDGSPDGELLAVYAPLQSPVLARLRRSLNTLPKRRSHYFGALARDERIGRTYGGRAALDHTRPDLYEQLVALGVNLADWYDEISPDQSNEQLSRAAGRHSMYRMVGPWSSCVVNHTRALRYHYDTRNVAKSWNAMVSLRHGAAGGHLVIPSWRLAFAMDDRYALLHDAHSTLHGVTPIQRWRRDGYRTSIAYYLTKRLDRCLPPDEELRRAQERSMARARMAVAAAQ